MYFTRFLPMLCAEWEKVNKLYFYAVGSNNENCLFIQRGTQLHVDSKKKLGLL
jgi:hypothetical protein